MLAASKRHNWSRLTSLEQFIKTTKKRAVHKCRDLLIVNLRKQCLAGCVQGNENHFSNCSSETSLRLHLPDLYVSNYLRTMATIHRFTFCLCANCKTCFVPWCKKLCSEHSCFNSAPHSHGNFPTSQRDSRVLKFCALASHRKKYLANVVVIKMRLRE